MQCFFPGTNRSAGQRMDLVTRDKPQLLQEKEAMAQDETGNHFICLNLLIDANHLCILFYWNGSIKWGA